MQDKERSKVHAKNRHSPVNSVVRVGPMMSIPAVLRELGSEPGPVFPSAGFKLTQFADPDTEVSCLAASRLLARCVAATGCQHFGLLVGKSAGPSSLGIAGFMLRSAPDVGAALRGLVQHLDLHDQGGVPTLLIKGNVTRLGYAIQQTGAEAAGQIYDLAMSVACNIMRGLCGESWNPAEVLLSRRRPQDLAPYSNFFRAPLRFNTVQSAVVFPARWLNHQIPSADPLLHHHLEREAGELHSRRDNNIVGQLRGSLRKSLLSRKCTLSDIAGQLCMHERTLHRRLREQGTSFSHELEDVRNGMSQQLLAESTMPIAKIAKALNYADVSAFSRAFKRWTEITPAQWRARNDSSQQA